MRNLRKFTAVVIAIALVLTSMTAAFAATTPVNADKAAILKSLGVYSGKDTTDPAIGLEDALTTEQSLTFLTDLFGYADAVNALTDEEVTEALAKFADAKDISTYAKKVIAYAATNGILSGSTKDGKFYVEPKTTVTAARFATFIVKKLGYAVPKYTEAVAQLSEVKGSKVSATETGDLTRDAAVGMMFGTLPAELAAGKTVIAGIVGTDAAKIAIAEKAGLITPSVLGVTSVKALNLKQFAVEFNGPVVKADAEKAANYLAYNQGGTTDLVNSAGAAALQADGKTVIVTLTTSFTNGTTATIEVKNIATFKDTNVKVVDTTVPSVVGVSVVGPDTLSVEYSEPVTNIAPAEYVVDSGNYMVTSATPDGTSKVTVKVGVPFTKDKEYKLEFKGNNLTDYAGYKIVPTTLTFKVAADTVAPIATVKSVAPNKAVITFSKPVTNVKDANVLYSHTYGSNLASNPYQLLGSNSLVSVTGGTATSATEITLDFTGKLIPLGTNKLYIGYSSDTGNKVQDLWGNKLAAVAIDISVSMDTVKPAVKEVKFIDSETMRIFFTEAIGTSATTSSSSNSPLSTSNYVIKDSTGATKSPTGVQWYEADASNKTYSVVDVKFSSETLGGGSYTVAVQNIADVAVIPNIMDAYSTTVAATDTVKPQVQVANVFISPDAVTTIASIYIPFTEAMDVASLVKGNILVSDTTPGRNFVALNDSNFDSLTVASDAKSIVLKVKNVTVANLVVRVGAVKDPAGNGLLSFYSDVTPANDSVAISKAEATAKNQIKVTFVGKLSSVTPKGFSVTYGATSVGSIALSSISHVINSDGNSEVIFSLGTELTESVSVGALGLAKLYAQGADETKSYLGTKFVGNGTAIVIDDKIAPTVNKATWINGNQIVVEFNEGLKGNTFAQTANGFSVSGGDSKLGTTPSAIYHTSGAAFVVIEGTGFTKDTVVTYNSAAGLTDLNSNKVADFSKKAE